MVVEAFGGLEDTIDGLNERIDYKGGTLTSTDIPINATRFGKYKYTGREITNLVIQFNPYPWTNGRDISEHFFHFVTGLNPTVTLQGSVKIANSAEFPTVWESNTEYIIKVLDGVAWGYKVDTAYNA